MFPVCVARAAAVLSVLFAASTAYAHASQPHAGESAGRSPRNWDELWRSWELEPGVVIPLLLSALWYGCGVWRMWHDAGVGRGIRTREAGCFAAGWLTLVVSLLSPLHAWGNVLFSAHMVQHELLMLLAAPLLVLGRPLVAMLKALPPKWARWMSFWTKAYWWQQVWALLSNAFIAWVVHAVVLWAWHIPSFFEATLSDEWIHALQHLSFLASALLFWWAVTQGPNRAMGYGAAVLYMFTTALHSGLLGALITFASSAWYPSYAQSAPAWEMTPLEDQQIGGLIMWVPACTVYIFAGLGLLAAWMRDSEARVRSWEAKILAAQAEHTAVSLEADTS